MTTTTKSYVDRDAVKSILTTVPDELVEIAEGFLMEVRKLPVHEVNFHAGSVPPKGLSEWDGISRCVECQTVHSPNADCTEKNGDQS